MFLSSDTQRTIQIFLEMKSVKIQKHFCKNTCQTWFSQFSGKNEKFTKSRFSWCAKIWTSLHFSRDFLWDSIQMIIFCIDTALIVYDVKQTLNAIKLSFNLSKANNVKTSQWRTDFLKHKHSMMILRFNFLPLKILHLVCNINASQNTSSLH